MDGFIFQVLTLGENCLGHCLIRLDKAAIVCPSLSSGYATIVDTFVDTFFRKQILLLKTDELQKDVVANTLAHKLCLSLNINPSFTFSIERQLNSRNSYRTDTVWHYLDDSHRLATKYGLDISNWDLN